MFDIVPCLPRSIKAFADKYLEMGLPLHMLINNAGVFLVPHDHTQEGFEVQLLSLHSCSIISPWQ